MVAALIAGCGSAATPTAQQAPSAATQPAENKTVAPTLVPQATQLTIATKADVETLDPTQTTSTTTWSAMSNIFDSLVRLNEEGNSFEPELALSWEMVDNTTWRFKLREGVKFQNGEDFNADAVKFTVDSFLDEERNPKARAFFASITGAKVIDPYTVDITTDGPYAILLTPLQMLFILPPKYTQEKGWDEMANNPVGTGAYRVIERKKGVEIKLEAFDGYWKGKPAISQLSLRTIPEDAARIAALQNGEVDIIDGVPYDRIKELETGSNTRVTSRIGEMVYIAMDTLKPGPFQDKRVRQGMNYAVNVDSIIENLLLGYGTRLNSPLFPQQPGYDPALKTYPYDPAKAKALFAEAGFPDGFSVEFSVAPNIQGLAKGKEVAEAIVEDLRKVGVDVTLRTYEDTALLDLYYARKLQMLMLPWKSNPESGRHMQTLLHSKTWGHTYQNPEADKRLDAYFAEMDPAKRIDIGKEMAQYLNDDCPWIYLYQQRDVYGASPSVAWEAKPDFLLRVRDITFK